MQQCNHCHYFVPDEHLSCPLCSAPLGQAPQPISIYEAPPPKGRAAVGKPLLIGIGGVLLLAIVAVLLVRHGNDSKRFVDSQDLAPVAADGWRPFYAPEGFTVAFPGTPQRQVDRLAGYTQEVVSYSVKDGDLTLAVLVLPAPAYAAAHEAAKRLEEWYRPVLTAQGATFEGASQLLTPEGDPAFDVVVVVNGTRKWMRYVTWNGSVMVATAELSAASSPTNEQSAAYKRMRDSLKE
jgi:hypothetical protein